MSILEYVQRSAEARVAIVSFRRLFPLMSRSGLFQFEDLIAQIDAVDIVAQNASMAEPIWRQRMSRAALMLGAPTVPSLRAPVPHLDKEYDLLFVACESAGDLVELGQLDPWLKNCRKAVCYIGEMWNAQRPGKGTTLAAKLGKFDHILLSSHGSTEFLADLIDRPVTYVPYAVDSLAFCPYPDPPERCIDLYSMGRRSELTHRAMQALASERNLFYLYDTVGNNNVDHTAHRRLLAEFIMRTKYFVAYPGKVNQPELLRGQEELAARHFEGAAGGAVMIGQAPDTPMFAKYFDYEGAVVDMPYDTEDVATIYGALESDREALERTRSMNVTRALLQHDRAYQWQELLANIGMKPLPQLSARIQRLRDLAASITPA